jgi:hypothetical protein
MLPDVATVLAHDRTLPVSGPLAPLLPDGALVRGRTYACRGVAATSLSLSLSVEAVAAGAWLVVVDLPWVGIEAAAELGVALERLVRVDGTSWADTVAALVDGFELVVTRPPARATASVVRKVQTRVQAREAVLILVDAPAVTPVDVALITTRPGWHGVADGHGRLEVRRIDVESSGRRIPRPRRTTLWLPGPTGTVSTVVPSRRGHRDEPEPVRFDDVPAPNRCSASA